MTGQTTSPLAMVDRTVQFALKWLTIALFALLTLLLTGNIVVRFWPFMSMHWFDEIVELLYAALVFYGAAALWASGGHFSVGDWISKLLPGERARAFYRLLVEASCVAFLATFLWYSIQLTLRTSEMTTVFQLPKGLLYSCMPISSAIMLAYSLKDVVVELRRLITGVKTVQGEQVAPH